MRNNLQKEKRLDIRILPLSAEDVSLFKRDMQAAFRLSAEEHFGRLRKEVLPEEDIDRSLAGKSSAAYKAVIGGAIVGGAIVSVDTESGRGDLELLYVRHNEQGKGIGKAIWQALERMYPEMDIWETVTPYFDTRNIHFYINQCGFHAVEFYNLHHKDPTIPDDMVGGDYFFRFEKKMSGRQKN